MEQVEVRHFRRTLYKFEGKDAQRCMVRQANLISNESDFHLIVTQAIMLYPAIRWLVGAQSLNDMSQMAPNFKVGLGRSENEGYLPTEAAQIRRMQSTFQQVLGQQPTRYWDKRNEFFCRCNTFLEVMSTSVNAVTYNTDLVQRLNKGRTTLGISLLECVISKNLSNYALKTHFGEIVDGLVYASGGDIALAMLDLIPDTSPQNSEQAFLYHNVYALFREYNRINELKRSNAPQTRKFVQRAEEFISIIDNAIEFVRTFPRIGEELYAILQVLSKHNVIWMPDYEIANGLGMTSSYYSITRQKAFTVLGAVLWGCDCSSLLTLLS